MQPLHRELVSLCPTVGFSDAIEQLDCASCIGIVVLELTHQISIGNRAQLSLASGNLISPRAAGTNELRTGTIL